MKHGVNVAIAIGTIKELEFFQQNNDKRFYQGYLSCERRSGTVDEILFIIEEKVLREMDEDVDHKGKRVQIRGQYLSYNEHIEGARHLKLFVSVQNIIEVDASTPAKNELILEGNICKNPILRDTPRGVKICDLMMAVNREAHGKIIPSYVPCICFGGAAKDIGKQAVGSELTIWGRIQSRIYTKYTKKGAIERTAYEIAVASYQMQV